MAKQKGIFKVQGTMGGVSFIKTQDGYMVKEKSEVSAEKIATSESFARTRENASEFGRAGKAGKVLRTAIRILLQNGKDNRVTSRLTKEMMRVIKADLTSTRGQRNVIDGETELLQGFEFNSNAKLSTTMFATYEATINRATGKLDIAVQPFTPARDLVVPGGSTHFVLVSAGSEIEFEKGTFVTGDSATAILPINSSPLAAISLSNSVTPNSTHPLFLLFGIQFFQQVNGINYPLKNGSYNALGMVKVSGV
jgi:hypothetical protein